MKCDCKTPMPYQNYPSLCARCCLQIEGYKCAFCDEEVKSGTIIIENGKVDNDLATCDDCFSRYLIPLMKD